MASNRDRWARLARRNLNTLLDRVREIEERGGLGALFEEAIDQGFESIGEADDRRVRRPKSSTEKTLRDYYANLEVPYGSDMETVKEAYRKLMRRYHPDRFAHNDQMQELSTSLTQEITRAYQAIESYWRSGRY